MYVKNIFHLYNGIFCAVFNDFYTLGMTCWRAQEINDGKWSEENGYPSSLVDFMEWYAKRYGNGKFSYPDDYCGYNLRDVDLKAVLNRDKIKDFNKYDEMMERMIQFILSNTSDKFCLIACKDGDYETLRHEFAHALYYTSPTYQLAQLNNLNAADPKVIQQLKENLGACGYAGRVFDDEIQAYLSTGSDTIADNINKKKLKAAEKIFEKTFLQTVLTANVCQFLYPSLNGEKLNVPD